MPTHTGSRLRIWLGVLLLIAGFLGHYFAARAIGGTSVAFRDHIAGFFIILLVTGGIIAGLGWRFWKGRRDVTVLIVGLVQALFGFWVYLQRFSVHG
jgi:hypothetical protein